VLVVLGVALVSLALVSLTARIAEFFVISVTLKLIALIQGSIVRCIFDIVVTVGLSLTGVGVGGAVICGAIDLFRPVSALVGAALVPLIVDIVRPVTVSASVWKLLEVGAVHIVGRCTTPVRGKALVWLA
jgi:hypothetical protein